MTEEIITTNTRIIQRLYKEVLVDWYMSLVDEFISPQFISHDWPQDGPTGPEAFKAYYSGVIRSVLPDARYEMDDIISERDKVVVRWRLLGTHKGRYKNIPPTDKFITLNGIAIYRLEDSKVAERWVITDMYSLLETLRIK